MPIAPPQSPVDGVSSNIFAAEAGRAGPLAASQAVDSHDAADLAPRRGQIVWYYALVVLGLHLLAALVFIPWLFSWTGVILMIAGIYVFGGLGINLCYHRLLAHRSFACPVWLERTFVYIALCCM